MTSVICHQNCGNRKGMCRYHHVKFTNSLAGLHKLVPDAGINIRGLCVPGQNSPYFQKLSHLIENVALQWGKFIGRLAIKLIPDVDGANHLEEILPNFPTRSIGQDDVTSHIVACGVNFVALEPKFGGQTDGSGRAVLKQFRDPCLRDTL
jgi:hypothetical protein